MLRRQEFNVVPYKLSKAWQASTDFLTSKQKVVFGVWKT